MTRAERKKKCEINGITCLDKEQSINLYNDCKEVLNEFKLHIHDGHMLYMAGTSMDNDGFLALDEYELILFYGRDFIIYSQYHTVKIKTVEEERIITKEYVNKLNVFLKVVNKLQEIYNEL
jgi:hypothetical protein